MPLKDKNAQRFQEKIQGKINREELPIEEVYIRHLQYILDLTMVSGSLGELHTILLTHFKLEPYPELEHVVWWGLPNKPKTETDHTLNPVDHVSNASPRIRQRSTNRNSDGDLVNKSD